MSTIQPPDTSVTTKPDAYPQPAGAVDVCNVLAAFARLADEGTLDEVRRVLDTDIKWSMPGVTWRGHTEVLSGLGAMREQGHSGPSSGTRHILSNIEVAVGTGEAAARSYFQLVSPAPFAILAGGSYDDQLIRTADGRWLLARRLVTPW